MKAYISSRFSGKSDGIIEYIWYEITKPQLKQAKQKKWKRNK